MAAGPWILTNTTLTKLHNGTFLPADSYKMALLVSAAALTPAVTSFAGVSTHDLSTANGYTNGGAACTLSVVSSDNTALTLDCTDVTWTASGGSIGPARYAVIYEVGGDIVAYMLLDATPADVTVTAGNDLDVVIHANGIYHTVAA